MLVFWVHNRNFRFESINLIGEKYLDIEHQFKIVPSQLESDVRLQKSLAATAKKFQSELAKLKNDLAEGKKSNDLGAGDKPNSEYEMLLREKDALIAEYLSGSDSKIIHSKFSVIKKPADCYLILRNKPKGRRKMRPNILSDMFWRNNRKS